MDPVNKILGNKFEKNFTKEKIFNCMNCGKPNSTDSYNDYCDKCKKLEEL